MRWIILLTVIIAIKVLLAKGIAFALILLSFMIKGRNIHKSEAEWNKYFLSLSKKNVFQYAAAIYSVATILSSCVMYELLKLFGFQYPMQLTIVTLIICLLLAWYKYQKSGRESIIKKFNELQKTSNYS